MLIPSSGSLTEGSCSLSKCSLLCRWQKYLTTKDFFCVKKNTLILYLTVWTWFTCSPNQDVGASLSLQDNRLTVFPRWINLHLYLKIVPFVPTCPCQDTYNSTMQGTLDIIIYKNFAAPWGAEVGKILGEWPASIGRHATSQAHTHT